MNKKCELKKIIHRYLNIDITKIVFEYSQLTCIICKNQCDFDDSITHESDHCCNERICKFRNIFNRCLHWSRNDSIARCDFDNTICNLCVDLSKKRETDWYKEKVLSERNQMIHYIRLRTQLFPSTNQSIRHSYLQIRLFGSTNLKEKQQKKKWFIGLIVAATLAICVKLII